MDLVATGSAAFCLIGGLAVLADGLWVESLAVIVALTALAVIVRIAKKRAWGRPRIGLAFGAVGLGIGALPNAGAFALFLVFAGVVFLCTGSRNRTAIALAVSWLALQAAQDAIAYHDPLLNQLIRLGLVALLMLLALGIGSAMRALEEARARADRLSAELRSANERLRASLVTERELVLAEERARSARELHDGLGHRLTLIAMSLEYADRVRATEPDQAWAEVAGAASSAREALEGMRVWVRALNPPRVVGNGAETFEQIADAFRGTGLSVNVKHLGQLDPLPDEVCLFATRLVQEGLTNVLRHARAQSVHIDVRQSQQRIRIGIRDDGHGWSGREGFGLRSLRERAEVLGGTLAPGSAPEGGFELVATLPLATAA